MKRAMFLVLLLNLELITNAQNLVMNPGFELWEKINKPDSWAHVENCLKDSSSVITGNYSCLHSGGVTSTSDLGQTIPVLAGNEYMLSFYYKTVITENGNGTRIWCYWKNSDGNSLSDPSTDAILRPSKYLKSDIWEQFNISITAPSEAVAFYLEVRTYPNSLAYFDDFNFEAGLTTMINDRNELSIDIYPNPARDYLNIKNINNIQQIDILDIKGATIWTRSYHNKNMVEIPVSGFPNGLYIICITASEKNIVRKFIKNGN